MIEILVFFVSSLLFAYIALYFHSRRTIKRRISQLADRKQLALEMEKNEDVSKPAHLKELFQNFAKNIRTTESTRIKIERELESAGVPLKVEEFITIRVGLFAITSMSAILLGIPFLFSVLVGFLGWQIPFFLLKRKKEKRIGRVGEQLPQTLEIMSSAMKSGFSFMQAMQLVANEIPDPIGVEFYRTIKDINYGMPMELAFEQLQTRIPNKDLEIVTTAILIQRSTGGNLSQILETIHETITERVRLKDELHALTAQGRISALVITLLPIGLGILLNLINPEYFTPMLSSPVGWILLGGGFISGLLGWIFINKVVTIEV